MGAARDAGTRMLMKLSETRPFLSLRLSLQGFYQGAAPLLAAIVIACTTSNLVWPHLKSEQLYRDVVVGPSTWIEISARFSLRSR
jgi:hypothetical protein